jgi:hypothetical protein
LATSRLSRVRGFGSALLSIVRFDFGQKLALGFF